MKSGVALAVVRQVGFRGGKKRGLCGAAAPPTFSSSRQVQLTCEG